MNPALDLSCEPELHAFDPDLEVELELEHAHDPELEVELELLYQAADAIFDDMADAWFGAGDAPVPVAASDPYFQYEPVLDPAARARPVPVALLFALFVVGAACAGAAVF